MKFLIPKDTQIVIVVDSIGTAKVVRSTHDFVADSDKVTIQLPHSRTELTSTEDIWYSVTFRYNAYFEDTLVSTFFVRKCNVVFEHTNETYPQAERQIK